MNGKNDGSLFIWLLFAAMIILIATLITVEQRNDSCQARCQVDGFYPLHVSKAAQCLCYDPAGIVRLPTDQLSRLPGVDQ